MLRFRRNCSAKGSGTDNCTTWSGTTYPNARQVDAWFDDTAPLDGILGRPTALHDSGLGGNVAEYAYLGTGTVVNADYPEPSVALTYVKQGSEPVGDAGDPYTGLDRFGRVVDQRWRKGGADIDRLQYGYNQASLRAWRKNTVTANRDEHYDYDGLYQVVDRKQGTLNAGNTAITGTPVQAEDWDYDPAGNWDGYNQENNGTATVTETRTHNPVNEITAINSAASVVQYDSAGNMTVVPLDYTGAAAGFTVIWDAWNRLVRVQGGPSTIDISYGYDGQHRRTKQTVAQGTAPSLDFYWNANWKCIEERDATSAVHAQYIYGERGRNDLLLRSNTIGQRFYALSDAMLSVTSVVDAAGNVQQRYNYTAFGVATLETGSVALDWPVLFHGEYYDTDTGWSNYGYRYYAPKLGRWLSRDPIEEAGGWNLYLAFANNPLMIWDVNGLDSIGGVRNWKVVKTEQTFLRKTPEEVISELSTLAAIGSAITFMGVNMPLPASKPHCRIEKIGGISITICSKISSPVSSTPDEVDAVNTFVKMVREKYGQWSIGKQTSALEIRVTASWEQCETKFLFWKGWVKKEGVYYYKTNRAKGNISVDSPEYQEILKEAIEEAKKNLYKQ